MLNVFRNIIFLFGLGIIFMSMYFIHAGSDFTGEHAFIWISIIVMYILIAGPFTFFRILPKTETFDKVISVYVASWYAITAYCSASIAILFFMIKRNVIIAMLMKLPDDWVDQAKNLSQSNETFAAAAGYSELIFKAVVVIQLILFFVLLIKIYLGCVVSHQIGAVAKRENQEFSCIKQLRSESQLLVIESADNQSLSGDIRSAISKIKDEFRYMSPVNSAEGFDYEHQLLDLLKTLRVMCSQDGDVSQEVAGALKKMNTLIQARKLVYKN